jgi:hypothetical protein
MLPAFIGSSKWLHSMQPVMEGTVLFRGWYVFGLHELY